MIPLYRYKRQMKSVLMAVWMCVHEKFSPSIPIEMQRKADLIHSHLLFIKKKNHIEIISILFFFNSHSSLSLTHQYSKYSPIWIAYAFWVCMHLNWSFGALISGLKCARGIETVRKIQSEIVRVRVKQIVWKGVWYRESKKEKINRRIRLNQAAHEFSTKNDEKNWASSSSLSLYHNH